MAFRSLPASIRARGVTAVLGPTNTGKTHLAIERLVAHESGIIGLPLRLLAREVYGRVVEKVGADKVALVTGEEKIKPVNARYWVATVEAMPRDLDVAFCAIDEIQLGADLDRGHVFTDRLLNQRGRSETLVIGSSTMRPLVESLLPGANIVSRPRLSKLSFAGEKKLTRLPRRSAIVAFSAEDVYQVAELIRRQKGGAAVVLGALSPRTRNAQVALFQSGDVDYLVATDAIGMGLNLDLDHVAFAGDRKFDGFGFRRLNPAEFGQIAGRAGRHMRDGTFGTTGRCSPFEAELVEALEDHAFEPVKMLQWRNCDLDMRSLASLQASLSIVPTEPGLTRAPVAEDVNALEAAARDEDVRGFAVGADRVERLWEVCQVPDYRKVSPQAHAELVITLYGTLMRDGVISDDWFARQIAPVDRTDGDIDTLSARIAQVRTWTFVANRPDWLRDPEHWQGLTRQVEDRLSDALHERLESRFVDRRTSVLMRRLRENAIMEAEVTPTGDVTVEGQHVGQLQGFHFVPDPQADGPEAKALRAAAQKALASEIDARAERFAAAADEAFVLSNDGTVRWTGEAVAKLAPGDKLAAPRLRLVADEHLTGPAREKVDARLELWLKAHVAKLLGPALALEDAPDLIGIARGIGFQVAESLGVLERSRVAQEVKGLDQAGRATLRKHGIRFGAYHIYLPQLLKPAPRALAVQLWALKHGGLEAKGVDDLPHLAASGRTSIPVDHEIDKALYRAAGFRVCGERAVRVDILERLADLIRPAIAYRPGVTPGEPPPGTADGEGFVVTVGMTSLVGCSGDDFASILRSLGYVVDRRAGPPITVPLLPAAPTVPAVPTAPESEGAADEAGPDEAQTSSAEPAGLPDGEQEISEIAAEETETHPDSEAPLAAAESKAEEITAAGPADEALPLTEEIVAADAEHQAEGGGTEGGSPEAAPATLEAEAPEAVEALVSDAVALESLPAETVAGEADAEATAESVAAAASAEANEPAEPVLIEVWRPHRVHHHRQQRPAHRAEGGRRHQGRPGGQAQGRDQARDQGRGPGEAPGRPAAAEGRGPRGRREDGAEQHAEAGQRPEHRQDQHRQGQHRQGQHRQEQHRQDRPGRHDRPERQDRQEGRHGRPDQRFRQDRAPERRFSAPKPEKAPDPNSPFAKLLILKERMESSDNKR